MRELQCTGLPFFVLLKRPHEPNTTLFYLFSSPAIYLFPLPRIQFQCFLPSLFLSLQISVYLVGMIVKRCCCLIVVGSFIREKYPPLLCLFKSITFPTGNREPIRWYQDPRYIHLSKDSSTTLWFHFKDPSKYYTRLLIIINNKIR